VSLVTTIGDSNTLQVIIIVRQFPLFHLRCLVSFSFYFSHALRRCRTSTCCPESNVVARYWVTNECERTRQECG